MAIEIKQQQKKIINLQRKMSEKYEFKFVQNVSVFPFIFMHFGTMSSHHNRTKLCRCIEMPNPFNCGKP